MLTAIGTATPSLANERDSCEERTFPQQLTRQLYIPILVPEQRSVFLPEATPLPAVASVGTHVAETVEWMMEEELAAVRVNGHFKISCVPFDCTSRHQ